MPKPRKPNFLKIISGTDQPCRMDDENSYQNAGEIISVCPPPPDWMPNAHAVKEWNRLGNILVKAKVLNEANLQIFGQVCALHGQLVHMWASHMPPTGHLFAQYRALVNDFGLIRMGTRDRFKIGNEANKKTNRFAKFKQP